MNNLYIRITHPEGYEDVHPDLILQDMNIDPVWCAEVVDVEAVLRECRRVFDYYDCNMEQWSVAEERKLRKEAIAKIDEVLK